MTNKLEITFEVTDKEVVLETNVENLSLLDPNDMILYSIGHNLISFYSFLQIASEEELSKVTSIVDESIKNYNNYKKRLN